MQVALWSGCATGVSLWHRVVRFQWLYWALLGLTLTGLAFAATPALAQDGLVPIPALKSRVTDLTSTLTQDQQASLEQTLQGFEARKGSQIAILIVPTTQPEAIEQFALRVVEQWQLGRKKVDDGVLFLIAKDDRRMRIEVGYGLEGGLNDAVAKRIISEVVTPYFKAGDFFGGVQAGLAAMVAVVDGEALPEPAASSTAGSAEGDFLSDSFVAVLFGAVFVGNFVRSLLGPLIAGLLTTVVLVPIIWFLQGSLVVSLIAGGFAGLIVLVGLRSGGGSRGGSFGSGRSSGGSFGGGGGRFGGGGASGGW